MYFQRSDTVTLGAGNAKAVNAATHVIDPWPRYVGNRRIPGNGDRLSRAVSATTRDLQAASAADLPGLWLLVGVTGAAAAVGRWRRRRSGGGGGATGGGGGTPGGGSAQ